MKIKEEPLADKDIQYNPQQKEDMNDKSSSTREIASTEEDPLCKKDEPLVDIVIQYPRQKQDMNSGNESPKSKSSSREITSTEEDPLHKKRRRCGDCTGCRAANCEKCPACLDMRKYGGPGTLRSACR